MSDLVAEVLAAFRGAVRLPPPLRPHELGRRIDRLAAQVERQSQAVEDGAKAVGQLATDAQEQQAEAVAALQALAKEVRKTRPADWATFLALLITIVTTGRAWTGGRSGPTPPPAITTATTAPSNLPTLRGRGLAATKPTRAAAAGSTSSGTASTCGRHRCCLLEYVHGQGSLGTEKLGPWVRARRAV